MGIFDSYLQKKALKYLKSQQRDIMEYVVIRIGLGGIPKEKDKILDIIEDAFDFVVKHGRPTIASVTKHMNKGK